MEVWENTKCCGNTSRQSCFHSLLKFSQISTSVCFFWYVFYQAGGCGFNCITFSKISFYALRVNITSFIGWDINNGTKGTSLDGEEGCLYGIHGVFLQTCQGLLNYTVIWSSPSSSRAMHGEGVIPNRRIYNTSFINPEDVFAQYSIKVLWRVGLELDRNCCWACVVCGYVCRREVWCWVLKNAKKWL